MKNKGAFTIAIISLVIFMGIASYLWYLYFHEYEQKVIAENSVLEFIRDVELVNTGSINYVNANVLDSDTMVPTYYFSVKNKANVDHNYVIIIEETSGNDGCTSATRFTKEELEYELKFENEVIKTGGLDTLANNVLDSNIVKANGTNDYSIKIKLKSDDVNYESKHFHYIINMKEKE